MIDVLLFSFVFFFDSSRHVNFFWIPLSFVFMIHMLHNLIVCGIFQTGIVYGSHGLRRVEHRIALLAFAQQHLRMLSLRFSEAPQESSTFFSDGSQNDLWKKCSNMVVISGFNYFRVNLIPQSFVPALIVPKCLKCLPSEVCVKRSFFLAFIVSGRFASILRKGSSKNKPEC